MSFDMKLNLETRFKGPCVSVDSKSTSWKVLARLPFSFLSASLEYRCTMSRHKGWMVRTKITLPGSLKKQMSGRHELERGYPADDKRETCWGRQPAQLDRGVDLERVGQAFRARELDRPQGDEVVAKGS